MSSKFTATRRTRARPPVCRAPLRGGVPVTPPANPTVLIAFAEWINTSGVPYPSISGVIDLHEELPHELWAGSIYQNNQELEITVSKTPGATTCDIELVMAAPAYADHEYFWNVPCTPDLCNWRTPLLQEIHIPDHQWHSVQIYS
jgi:hypothetical protein